jgi:hypothetical protein
MAPNALSQRLLPTTSSDEDCEWLTNVTSCTSSSKLDSEDDTDDAGSIITSSSPSQLHEKLNGFVLAVLILFSSSGMTPSVLYLATFARVSCTNNTFHVTLSQVEYSELNYHLEQLEIYTQ